MARIRRQAVVVIHGVGEQKPMATLRGFVAAVLPGAEVFSKPDTLSRSYELRRFTARHGPRRSTDFFELYWADKVQGTTVWHLVQWGRTLLFRRWARVPVHLRGVWLLTWLFVVLVLGLVAAGARVLATPASLGGLGWLSVVVPLLVAVPQAFLVYYLGDAARYLSPSPANVGVRHAVRQAGVDLFERLHADRKYGRIVVVGHSLGSVIAYDVLMHYWAQVHAAFANPARQRQMRLRAFEDLLLTNQREGSPPDAYRRHQRLVWTELRRHGHPWRVTDLVTLGSPLAHAAVLLAADHEDFVERCRDRELVTNPPQPDFDGTLSYPVTPPIINARGQPVSPRAPHHAAAFCCTRWTNLYFPAAGGLFGDVIGGPLRPLFGEGVRDVPLLTGGLWRHTFVSHARYWRAQDGASGGPGTPIAQLARALDLEWIHDRTGPVSPAVGGSAPAAPLASEEP